MKWAKYLLLAEDFHAGKIKMPKLGEGENREIRFRDTLNETSDE